MITCTSFTLLPFRAMQARAAALEGVEIRAVSVAEPPRRNENFPNGEVAVLGGFTARSLEIELEYGCPHGVSLLI
jgi:hypothetical protein